MNNYRIRRALPSDATALVKLGRAVSSEPEAWLITESDWRGVGDERVEPGEEIVAARPLALVGEAAEAPARLALGGGAGEAARDELVDALVEVEAHLAMDVAGDGVGAEVVEQAAEQRHEALRRNAARG